MKKKLEAYNFTHKGKRKTNEDFVISDPDNGIFIIADGLGGHDYGEVASKIVSQSCYDFLLNKKVTNEEQANEMMLFIQEKLISNVQENPAHLSMGTTLACVQFNNETISIMHIGDSRVYHLNAQSEIFWCTRDDSYVQELVEAGIISKEKAETHAYRNRLTKSISANGKHKEVNISFKLLTNLGESDILFLCTDGVFDSYSEKSLLHHLRQEKNGINLLKKLEKVTEEISSDNTTAIFVAF